MRERERVYEKRTVLAAHLLLGNDELHAVVVVRGGDGVLEEADGADDFAVFVHLLLTFLGLVVEEVCRVGDELVGLDGLVAGPHAHKLAVVAGDDLVDRLVEHVGAAVDGAEASKALGQFA